MAPLDSFAPAQTVLVNGFLEALRFHDGDNLPTSEFYPDSQSELGCAAERLPPFPMTLWTTLTNHCWQQLCGKALKWLD